MKERLYQPSVLHELFKRHGFTIKKSFGQNFLIDQGVLHDIVEAARSYDDPCDRCVAVEIGPGMGTLTQALAEGGFDRVIAIEKDRRLRSVLQETVGDYDHVQVLFGDALEMDMASLLADEAPGASVRLVANLPYYITTPIIMGVLESSLPLERMVVMVQKEVAERMIAPPGGKDYGALSVAVQYYSQPELVRTVSPGCFIPNPAVESAVVLLRLREPQFAEDLNRELFFRIVKAAFAQRRKTIANALHSAFSSLTKSAVQDWLEKGNIDPKRRGETLSLTDFAVLATIYETPGGKNDSFE